MNFYLFFKRKITFLHIFENVFKNFIFFLLLKKKIKNIFKNESKYNIIYNYIDKN